MPGPDEPEPQEPAADTSVASMEARYGLPTPITCPACGGALWESSDSGAAHYACHVGHQYGAESLLAEHGEAVEQALWSAVRILEQHAELRGRMAGRAQAAGLQLVAEKFAEDARGYEAQAREVRRLVVREDEAPVPRAAKRGAR